MIREIHPQGHLSGIARTIAEQGLDLERFIISVPLDDDFFARRTVRVIPRADFATDMIQSINVSLDYEGDVRNAVFDAATAEQTVEWPSSLESGQMPRRRHRVVGGDVRDDGGRPAALDRVEARDDPR